MGVGPVLPIINQPADSDLTAIAALSTTAFGRSLLEAANGAAVDTIMGLPSRYAPLRSATQATQYRITEATPTEVVTPAAFAPLTSLGTRPVVVDPGARAQQVLGFGAALTEASAYLIMRKLTRQQRWQLLHDLFGPGGLSMLRIAIGGSDFNTGPWWSCAPTTDGKLTTAASAGDTSIALNMLYPAGTELRIDTSSSTGQSELVTVVGTPTGTGPFTTTITPALAHAHPVSRLVVSTDRTLSNFTLLREESMLIPLVKEILAINPTLRIHAAVWTIPSWMRNVPAFASPGTIFVDAYEEYAAFLVLWLQQMASRGVPIWSVSLQNEPAASAASFVYWTASEYATFVSDHLGPALDAAGLTTKVLVHDHHWSYGDYARSILADVDALPYVGGVGWHGYGGSSFEQHKTHRAYPDVPQHFTEMRTLHTQNWATSMQVMAGDCAIGALRNWAESVTLWNLALDEDGQPTWYTGSPARRGVVTIPSSGTGSITYGAEYHLFRRLAAVVQLGAVRCDSTTYAVGSTGTDLETVAFVNPDESIVLLAYNPTASAISSTIVDGRTGQGFTVSLGAGEVSVFTWGATAVLRATDATYVTPAAPTSTPTVLSSGSSIINSDQTAKVKSGTVTVPSSGSNRCLIVAVGVNAGNQGVSAPQSVTCNGVSMSFLDFADNKLLTSTQRMVALFYLLDPPTGSVTIEVRLVTESLIVARAITLGNVNQTEPFGPSKQSTSASTATSSVDITGVSTDLIFGACCGRTSGAMTAPGGTTLVSQDNSGNTRLVLSTQPTGAPATVSFTQSPADSMSMVAFAIHGA